MIRILFLTLFSAICLQVYAQKESANWFFGNHAGLDFLNTQTMTDESGISVANVPTYQTSPLSTREGCFTLSDRKGNIIVFSDGVNVYNKNKTLIDTGLAGNTSTAQSGILIPWPENPGFYFIVCNSQHQYIASDSGGISYSVFMADANNGNGEVRSSDKNTALGTTGYVDTKYLFENIAAVKHDNGIDYWLLNRTGQYMFAWLITKNGFVSNEPTAVTIIPGTNYTALPSPSEGYMKLSPDGKYICHVSSQAPEGEILLADFDTSTGKISNVKLRKTFFPYGTYIDPSSANDLNRAYGLEFSPGGKNLFLTQSSWGCVVIPVDEFMTANFRLVTDQLALLQTGMGGRVYGIGRQSRTLGIIPNPDDDIANIKTHVFKNYFSQFFASEFGLPNFVASFFDASAVERQFACVGNEFKYSVEVNMSGSAVDLPVELRWDFGDASAIVTQNIIAGTTLYKQPHNYATAGKYTIKVTPYKANGAALTPINLPARVTDCVFQTNRMIRTDLLNAAQQLK